MTIRLNRSKYLTQNLTFSLRPSFSDKLLGLARFFQTIQLPRNLISLIELGAVRFVFKSLIGCLLGFGLIFRLGLRFWILLFYHGLQGFSVVVVVTGKRLQYRQRIDRPPCGH